MNTEWKFVSSVIAALAVILTAGPAHAKFLPDNNLDQEDSFAASNLTEEQFNAITDSIVAMFQPLAKEHGAELSAEKDWVTSTVNAYANQSGNQWIVHMYGGLARRPEVTPDGFAMVVCHELGHHFGGYAFYGGGNQWAAAEGQADYFATHVCARRIWGQKVAENIAMAQRGPAHLANACDSVWKDDASRALCYRTTEAGLSLASLLAALGGDSKPSIDTRDTSKVESTYDGHPRAQCRLDTYFHGALCTQAFDVHVIPGKKDGGGENTPEAETEASKYSCTEAANFQVGYRPRCWFKPLLSNGFDDGNTDTHDSLHILGSPVVRKLSWR